MRRPPLAAEQRVPPTPLGARRGRVVDVVASTGCPEYPKTNQLAAMDSRDCGRVVTWAGAASVSAALTGYGVSRCAPESLVIREGCEQGRQKLRNE